MISQYEPPLHGLARLGYVRPTTQKHGARDTTTRVLDCLYRIADPLETRGEFERYYHIDLAGLSLDALRSEERKILYRLDFDERPSPWFFERLHAVRGEIARQRKGPTQEPPLPSEAAQRHAEAERQLATRHHTRGVPLAVRRIDAEGGHD